MLRELFSNIRFYVLVFVVIALVFVLPNIFHLHYLENDGLILNLVKKGES